MTTRGRTVLDAVGSGEVREHVDYRAAGILHEEATHAPRFVGERIDDAQTAAYDLRARRVNCRWLADVEPEAWRRIRHPAGEMRTRSEGWSAMSGPGRDFHRDLEPKHLDVEVPRRRKIISVSIRNDSADHDHIVAGTLLVGLEK